MPKLLLDNFVFLGKLEFAKFLLNYLQFRYHRDTRKNTERNNLMFIIYNKVAKGKE